MGRKEMGAQPILRRRLSAMRQSICFVALTFFLAGIAHAQPMRHQTSLIAIHGPSIVAFFFPMTEAEANSGEGDAEALDDFNFYFYSVEKRLKKAGIEFQQFSGRSFTVLDGGKRRSFHTGKIGIGYYFIAPGKEPHVEYGVMTDEDLVDASQKYFGFAIPEEE
jgi:hypothetical protein